MTETLNTAIEKLLQSLQEQGDSAAGASEASLLSARLLADFSQALESKTAARGDGLTLVNEIAAHLDGFPLGAEREAFIAALAKSADDRAALQSAALFLHDLVGEAQPVSSSVFNEAMAAFAPEMAVSAPAAAAARAPHSSSPRRNWRPAQGFATFAALFVVGVIGGREISHLGHFSSPPTTSTSTTTASPQPVAPQPSSIHNEAVVKGAAAVGKKATGGLAPSEKDCDAAAPNADQLAAPATGTDDGKKPMAAKAPCRPVTHEAAPAARPQPNLPSGADQH
ncbi:MAG TPA: hypothetical protein VGG12_00480 [Methylovirgula sp.]|jgi:hypothetical protein